MREEFETALKDYLCSADSYAVGIREDFKAGWQAAYSSRDGKFTVAISNSIWAVNERNKFQEENTELHAEINGLKAYNEQILLNNKSFNERDKSLKECLNLQFDNIGILLECNDFLYSMVENWSDEESTKYTNFMAKMK